MAGCQAAASARSPELGQHAVRAGRAEVDDLLVVGCELVEDAFDAFATLDRELHLDCDVLAVGEQDGVRDVLARSAPLLCEQLLTEEQAEQQIGRRNYFRRPQSGMQRELYTAY